MPTARAAAFRRRRELGSETPFFDENNLIIVYV
jgi:hypothetical protein